MNALTTIYTPPAWCADRYAVFIATPPWDSTNVPSSGWVDPSFTMCIPSQYSNTYPSFSPGICPQPMTIVASESNVSGRRTVWTGRCCQSGFTTPDINPDFFCTSAVTAPIPLLLIPAITTTDIYTTLPGVKSIQHDQVTVLWEETDLSILPRQVAGQYASMMGLTGVPALTVDIAATNPATTSADTPSPSPSIGPSSTPPLPPAITSTSSSNISTSTDDAASSPTASLMSDPENSTSPQLSTNSNTVAASFTSAPSVTTIRPPSQSWFPVSTRTSTEVSPAGTTSNTRTSTTVRPSQSTTTNWPPSTPVNTSSSLRSQTRRLRDLCLLWTSLFVAMYFT